MLMKKTQKLQNEYKENSLWEDFVENLFTWDDMKDAVKKEIMERVLLKSIDDYNNAFNTSFFWREVTGGKQFAFLSKNNFEVASIILEY